MVSKGLRGALLLGVSGTILFYLLYIILWDAFHNVLYSPIWEMWLFSFIGSLSLGLGLWQIVETGKPDKKQNPS